MPAPLSAAAWDRLTARVATARDLAAPALADWWREVARHEPELLPWLRVLLGDPDSGGAAEDRPTSRTEGDSRNGRF